MLVDKTKNKRDIFICVMALFGGIGGFAAVHFASDHLGDGLSLPIRMALCAAIGALGIILAAVLFAGTFFLISAIKRRLGKLHEGPRRKGTRGREFLLLLDKDARQQCRLHWKRQSKYYRYWFYTSVAFNAFALFRMIYDLRDPSTSKPLGLLVFLIAILLVYSIYLVLLRFDILLPIYRQRRQAKAQAERDAITQRIEVKLPQARYRVSGLTITSIEQFRNMASERQLPEEFVADAKDLECADRELMEAEADMPAQPQTKAQTT